MKEFTIGILGGGLAGLTAAIHLAKQGLEVTVYEKQNYPHHKVCGEYVSNEVLAYFNYLDIPLDEKSPKRISKLRWTTINGRSITIKLPLGGFGISRFTLDNMLFEKAKSLGVLFVHDTINSIEYDKDKFIVGLHDSIDQTHSYVIGAFGKRSTIDKLLSRDFISKKTRWMAVKAHYRHDTFKDDLVELHNFEGGYCGISKVETNAVNVCYLTTYDSFQKHKDIENFQEQVLSKNEYLNDFFTEAERIFEKPLSIAQISFENKPTVDHHIPMIGDAAGLIHPLCGNGMAMAIHSAKLVSEVLINAIENNSTRSMFENEYSKQWRTSFNKRLKIGAMLQTILLNKYASKIAISTVANSSVLLKQIIKSTHGKPIEV